METLVATVIIVIIFMISSMILNNIFGNTLKSNTDKVSNRITELEYLYRYDKVSLPYQEEFEDWVIYIESFKKNNNKMIRFEGVHKNSDKELSYSIYAKP